VYWGATPDEDQFFVCPASEIQLRTSLLSKYLADVIFTAVKISRCGKNLSTGVD